MRRFLDQPLWVRVLRGIVLAALVAAVAFYTPTPYLLEAPGRAVPASDIIDVFDAKAHPVNGRYLMTTVLIEKASVMLCIYGWLDPQATLTRQKTSGHGEQAQSPNDDSRQMELSQYLSTRVALETLGYRVHGEYRGLKVLDLVEGSPNIGALQAGDTIVEMGSYRPPSFDDFRNALSGKTSNDRIAAVVNRGGRLVSVTLRLFSVEGRLRIGVVLSQEYDNIELPVDVVFHSGNTSGASAGLVFALEIYDRLSPDDLARGRTIAATGTLEGNGQVGGVEGIAFKLVAAERSGADIFVIPRENWEEIKNVASSVKVIPVDTFQEALDALR